MFKCQRDSFLKKDHSVVVSCEKVEDVKKANKVLALENIAECANLYKVVLEDTILFPEGGGQPDDRGTIDGVAVVRVIRDGTTAVHYVVENASQENGNEGNSSGECKLPFEAGKRVTVEIDWSRRSDNMQQHSGQHLITAIADQIFGFATTSWYLGKEDSFIELGFFLLFQTPKKSQLKQMAAIEDAVNEKINEGLPCTVDVVELDDPKLKTARGRNLPADVTGNIRIITMAGVESNVCCGTHVRNLSQLQMIKLLSAVPKKGKTQLYFLSGNRVSKRFSDMLRREGELMKILKTNPADLPSACDKINVALRSAKKSILTLSKDLAALEAKAFKEGSSTESKLWHFHKDNVDADYAAAFLRELGSSGDRLVFLTFKSDATAGNVYLLKGKNTLDDLTFKNLCDEICTLLDGKGSLRGEQYQAKIAKPSQIAKAVACIENVLKSKTSES